MQIVTDTISIAQLQAMSEKMFNTLVKAVVDIEQEIMMVDADLHADQEHLLLEQGSKQENLWGINLYPAHVNTDNFIEFDSMINLRPAWGNVTRGVDNPALREKIKAIVYKLVRI